MGIQFHRESYDNISQRAVATLAQGLIPLEPLAATQLGGAEAELVASQRDLHGFFTALYAAMYQDPPRFGMPISPDDALAGEGEGKERKQEVTKKIKRPQEIIDITIALLRELGLQGQVVGNDLVMDEGAYHSLFESKGRTKKTILSAMSEAGLAVQAGGSVVTLRNTQYPQMMPAFKAIADRCAADGDEKWGASTFARCDFRVLLPDYHLDPISLLGYFPPDYRARAVELHNYMVGTGHQALCRAYNPHGWDIQYQGARKIKGSPLVQIDYSERHKNPMRVQIKCASADRLIPSFSEQPPAVQADFRGRVNRCGGASCGWCKDKKGLNPSVLEYGGEKLTICWYTRPDVAELNDETLEVLRGYVRWHQKLV